jgi:predicted methyltransferase
MKVLTENFGDLIITDVIREQYRYRQEQQKRDEDAQRNAAIKKQTGSTIKLPSVVV